MKRNAVFENYDYQQQAKSVTMVINSIVGAVSAHIRKGRQQNKKDVEQYRDKVIRLLELVIEKLRRMD